MKLNMSNRKQHLQSQRTSDALEREQLAQNQRNFELQQRELKRKQQIEIQRVLADQHKKQMEKMRQEDLLLNDKEYGFNR